MSTFYDNLYTWEGSLGDPEGDDQERWARYRRRGRPVFDGTKVIRCKSCDGFMPDERHYCGKIVSDYRASNCHHCRGDVRCAAGKHWVKPNAHCYVCDIYKHDPTK